MSVVVSYQEGRDIQNKSSPSCKVRCDLEIPVHKIWTRAWDRPPCAVRLRDTSHCVQEGHTVTLCGGFFFFFFFFGKRNEIRLVQGIARAVGYSVYSGRQLQRLRKTSIISTSIYGITTQTLPRSHRTANLTTCPTKFLGLVWSDMHEHNLSRTE